MKPLGVCTEKCQGFSDSGILDPKKSGFHPKNPNSSTSIIFRLGSSAQDSRIVFQLHYTLWDHYSQWGSYLGSGTTVLGGEVPNF